MSRRTPIRDLQEEESTAPNSPRRRSTRIAATATVTTRRASATEELTPARLTRSKRLSLSQDAAEDDDASSTTSSVSSSKAKVTTRGTSKSPLTLKKIEEVNDIPARRTRSRGSISSLADEKEERMGSPAPTKLTTRRRSAASAGSTSPTSQVDSVPAKVTTPRKSARSFNASPSSEIAKLAPPKLRGRRASVTEKIIPMDCIEESESKAEDDTSTTKSSIETETKAENKNLQGENNISGENQIIVEETKDENTLFKKKKTAMMIKQNLQTIAEDNGNTSIVDESHDQKKETEKEQSAEENTNKEEDKKESSFEVGESPKNSKTSIQDATNVLDVSVEKQKASKHENSTPPTPETKSKLSQELPKSDATNVLGVSVDKKNLSKQEISAPRTPETKSKLSQELPKSDATNVLGVSVEKKNLSKQEISAPRTPETKSKLSQELAKSDKSPESKEEKELKSLLITDVTQKSPRKSLRLSDPASHEGNKQACSDPVNMEESDESFSLNLEISKFETTQESLKLTADEKSKLITSQENDLNISGSSDASDKENQQQIKMFENKSSPKVGDISSIKASSPQVIVVLNKILDKKGGFDKSPTKEFGKTSENFASPQKSQTLIEQSFCEPMEVDECSFYNDKEDSTEKSLAEKLKEPVKEDVGFSAKETHESPSSVSKIYVAAKNDILKVDVSHESLDVEQVQVVETELAKLSSPRRRSARLLQQSQGDSPEGEDRIVNSTPKKQLTENNVEDPEKSFNANVEESAEEADVVYKESGVPNIEHHIAEDAIKNNVNLSQDEEANKSDTQLNLIVSEDQEIVKEKCAQNKSSDDIEPQTDKNTSVDVGKSNDSLKITEKDEKKQLIEMDTDDIEDEDSIILVESDEEIIQDSSLNDPERNNKNTSKQLNDSTNDLDVDDNDEQLRFSEGSNSGDNSTKNKSKNSSLKNSQKDGKSTPKRLNDFDIDDDNGSEKSNADSNDEGPKFSEDSSSEDNVTKNTSTNSSLECLQKNNKNSSKRLKELTNDSDTNDFDDNDSKSEKSNIDSNDEEPKFSEDSSSGDIVNKNKSKNDTTLENKQKGTGNCKQMKKSIMDTEEKESKSDDEEQENVTEKRSESTPSRNDLVESPSKAKAKIVTKSSIIINSDSEIDLDTKLDNLIAEHQEDSDSNSSYESVVDYLDNMAEEGEEDTPSEGSNDIIDVGESVGSSESEVDSDETYDDDSFIDDNEEHDDLLSGEEYDLGQEKKKKQPKKKRSRIIELSDTDEENKENELSINKTNGKETQVIKGKSNEIKNGIEEDSDLEKMSTQPYCGLTPPSIVSLRDSLSDSDKIICIKEDESSSASVLINKEDNLKSLEELKETIKHKCEEIVAAQAKPPLKENSPKTSQSTSNIRTMFTPNNSLLEDETTRSSSARKRQTSLTIQENVKLKDIQELNISDRVSKAVDFFCSTVDKDGKDQSGNISVNISLEFLKSPSRDDEESETDDSVETETKIVKTVPKVSPKKRLSSEVLTVAKSNLQEQIKFSPKKRLSSVVLTVAKSNSQEQIKFSPKKRLSSEGLTVAKNNSQEQIKLSAKKEKKAKLTTPEDRLSTRKSLSQERLEKSFASNKPEQNQSQSIAAKPGTQMLSEDKLEEKTSNKNEALLEDFANEEKLTKKDKKKKKKKQKQDSSLSDKKEEKKTKNKKQEKSIQSPKFPEILISSDSSMSEYFDDEYQKYSNKNLTEAVEFENTEARPKKSKKARSKPKVDTNVNDSDELVKKVKKRKRDTSVDLIQENRDVETLTKTKGKKNKLQDEIDESVPYKKVKKSKTKRPTQLDFSLSDEVFVEEPCKVTKTLPLPSIKNSGKKSETLKITTDEISKSSKLTKKMKDKNKRDQVGLTTVETESKVQYFPSRILVTLTKGESSKKVVAVTNQDEPVKKPKVLPSTKMPKRSWNSDGADFIMPSSCSLSPKSKKRKTDFDFNVKDFKNNTLYDPKRVSRVDTNVLLKKKQKMKF